MKKFCKLFLTSMFLFFSSVSLVLPMKICQMDLSSYYFTDLATLELTFLEFQSKWHQIESLVLDVHMIVNWSIREKNYGQQLSVFLTEKHFPELKNLTVTTHCLNFESTLKQIVTALPHLKKITLVLKNPPKDYGFMRWKALPDNFKPENLPALEEIYFVNYSNSSLSEKKKQFCSYYKEKFGRDLIFLY